MGPRSGPDGVHVGRARGLHVPLAWVSKLDREGELGGRARACTAVCTKCFSTKLGARLQASDER